jgi:mannitol/fructose-specific phosphotransferase system IIA component (Ntr-type)
MKFVDFVSSIAVRPNLAAIGKEDVIREMTAALVEAGDIQASELESTIKAIAKREELGSTGIGRGVAVPHTKHPSVDRLVGTVGVSVQGVDFKSLDGEKVHLFFLLISPPDKPGDHLRALENISRQLRDDTFCRFLKQSKTAADIWQLLEEADNNQFVS